MKKSKKLFSLLLLASTLIACNNDENQSNTGNVALVAKSTVATSSRFQNRSTTVDVTSFLLNLKEIEFEYDDDNQNNDDDSSSNFGFDDNVKFSGPFELNLLTGNVPITFGEVPNANYEEIEFKLDKNKNPNSNMFNKSIEISGTINGTKFVYWDNEDEDFEVDFDDKNKNIVIENNNLTFFLVFDIKDLFKDIDMTSAQDRNGDGVIEIGPNDQDGNSSLADKIDDKIEKIVKLD